MNYLSDRYTGPSEAWHTSEHKLLIPHRSALFKPQARTTGRGCPWVPSMATIAESFISFVGVANDLTESLESSDRDCSCARVQMGRR